MSKSKFLEILEKRGEKKVKLQEKLQEITGMQWYISLGSADLNDTYLNCDRLSRDAILLLEWVEDEYILKVKDSSLKECSQWRTLKGDESLDDYLISKFLRG